MKKQKFILLLVSLSILVTGCQVFPYVYEDNLKTQENAAKADETPALETNADPSLSESSMEIENTETLEPETPELTETESSSLDTQILYFPVTFLYPTFDVFLQDGTPLYTTNFSHPNLGCEWFGVAGQVFDPSGKPLEGLLIRIGGEIDEKTVEITGLTGAASDYGLGGYEIQLGETPFASKGKLWIQVCDSEGNALTERYSFDTFEDCSKNLIVINFSSIQINEQEAETLNP